MKQTAVEWLFDNLNITGGSDDMKAFEQAKAMEKEQIGKAFLNGRIEEIGSGVLFDLQPLIEKFDNYYKETYESKTNL
jgi:hypothetical protein